MDLMMNEDLEGLIQQLAEHEPALFDKDYHFKLADLHVKVLMMKRLDRIAHSLEGLYLDGIIQR